MPDLVLIAGCNGSGKSTYASAFLPSHLKSFDYDKRKLEIYNSLEDSELREKFAKDQTTREFEIAISNALAKGNDFCYETNFDAHPVFWLNKFKETGYTASLIFFCLENIEIAKHRVMVRTEFKGHFVNDDTIDYKWKEGYKNANLHFSSFDKVLIVDNSDDSDLFINVLQIENHIPELMSGIVPEYFPRRFPDIYKSMKQHGLV